MNKEALEAKKRYHREYYKKNREKILAYHKRWREENKEKYEVYAEKRWSKMAEYYKQEDYKKGI